MINYLEPQSSTWRLKKSVLKVNFHKLSLTTYSKNSSRLTLFILLIRYAEVKDIYLPTDHNTGDFRGFGFVEFYNQE